MGALHAGHLSLVNRATDETPLVVTSIYVNPTQFNDPKDLENYPRTLEEDLALLKNHLRTDDIVFTPSDREIYPEKDTRQFHFGNLVVSNRPGHHYLRSYLFPDSRRIYP